MTKSTKKSLHIFQLFSFYLEKGINDKHRIFLQHRIFRQRADEEEVVTETVVIMATECLPGTVLSTFLPATKQAGEGGPHLLLPP